MRPYSKLTESVIGALMSDERNPAASVRSSVIGAYLNTPLLFLSTFETPRIGNIDENVIGAFVKATPQHHVADMIGAHMYGDKHRRSEIEQ